MSDLIEKMAQAVKAEIGRQLNANPLLGDPAYGDWYADLDGSLINLETCVTAALKVITESGYAVVPVEATEEMIRAGWSVCLEPEQHAEVWSAMLAAAPKVLE